MTNTTLQRAVVMLKGKPLSCRRCGEGPLAPGTRTDTPLRHGGRGLCVRCHKAAWLDGTLLDYRRVTRPAVREAAERVAASEDERWVPASVCVHGDGLITEHQPGKDSTVTVPATIDETHRHRFDPQHHPERVPFGDLLRKVRHAAMEHRLFPKALAGFPPADHDTVVMEPIGDDRATAHARELLEQHRSAFLAPERRADCGGQVRVMGSWYRCPEPGVWGVTGRPARFCAVHAAVQCDLDDRMARAQAKADAAKAGV